MDLKEEGFRIAFSIEDYYAPRKLKNDPKFTKWLIRAYGMKDGEFYEEKLEYHICTDEDYAEFYPIQPRSVGLLDEIKRNPDRGFFCLNWNGEAPYKLWGGENNDDYQRFEVNFLPCNSISDDLGIMKGELGVVSPDCETDLEEQIKYVGSSNLLIMAN